jgi:2-polyprenyl-3-methyl-5-hydroxy-6-metoxy-1,4-benzoquinol methylase
MRVDFDSEKGTVTVDDVVISLEVLQHLANPDAGRLYRFERIGDTIWCQSQLIEVGKAVDHA